MAISKGILLALSFLCAVVAPDPCPKGPTFPNTAAKCNAYHTVVSGDGCWSLQQKYFITQAQFLTWNPSVSKDCQKNFWLGNSYCVGVGAKKKVCSTSSSSAQSTSTTIKSSTSSGALSSTSVTSSVAITSNATYSTRWPVITHNVTKTPRDSSWPPSRTQAGQPETCRSWHYVKPGDTCDTMANAAGSFVTRDMILEWNPTLGSDCSGLYVGWWFCNGIKKQSSLNLTWSTTATNASIPAPTKFVPSSTKSLDPAFTPSPSQAGMPSTCQAYYLAVADDTCRTILATYTYITQEQFFAWNPALRGNCDGLWVAYYYCVANFSSSSVPMPTVTATPTASLAAGATASCKAWYKTSTGDTCDRITLMFGRFDKSDLISWNPSLLSDCSAYRPLLLCRRAGDAYNKNVSLRFAYPPTKDRATVIMQIYLVRRVW